MLYFIDACVSYDEIPNELSLCIYISGCMNRCPDCHYPELMQHNHGDILSESFYLLVDLYSEMVSCICFLGEGACGLKEKAEFKEYVDYIHSKGLLAGLYSGRNLDEIEEWMKEFDFVKIGSYQLDKGPLTKETTNQRMYKKKNNKYVNITEEFWNNNK